MAKLKPKGIRGRVGGFWGKLGRKEGLYLLTISILTPSIKGQSGIFSFFFA
jgi:hypothetical protein